MQLAKPPKTEPVPLIGSEWYWSGDNPSGSGFGRRVINTFEWGRDQYRTTYIVYGEFRLSDGDEIAEAKVTSLASWTKAVRGQRPYLRALIPVVAVKPSPIKWMQTHPEGYYNYGRFDFGEVVVERIHEDVAAEKNRGKFVAEVRMKIADRTVERLKRDVYEGWEDAIARAERLVRETVSKWMKRVS